MAGLGTARDRIPPMCAIVIIECSGCRLDYASLVARHPDFEFTGVRHFGPGWFDFAVCSYDQCCLCPPSRPKMLDALERLLVDLKRNASRVLYHPNDVEWSGETVTMEPAQVVAEAPPRLDRGPLRVVIEGTV